MWHLTRLFCIGAAVSFIGALPLGMLNLTAVRLSLSQGPGDAAQFALGVVAVEMAYVWLTLKAMRMLERKKGLLRMGERLTLLLLVALAADSFHKAWSATRGAVTADLPISVHPLPLGLMMSAVNPLQIPFWLGWSSLLSSRGLLTGRRHEHAAYIGGIGIGSVACFSLFIHGGKWLVGRVGAAEPAVLTAIGAAFLLTAGVQLWRMQRRRTGGAGASGTDAHA